MLLLAGSILLAGPAKAWDVAVGTFFLDNALYVSQWSGPGTVMTTIDERVRATEQAGSSFSIFWTAQTWDAEFGEWPQADLLTSGGVAFASLFNDQPTTERWTSAEAVVFGSLAPGRVSGSGVAFDFDFQILPFTTGDLFLDPGETYMQLASDPGDVGSAFSAMKLYRPDVDPNAPGGANFPLAQFSQGLAAGGAPIDTTPTFTWSFQNPTGTPQTQRLRFELSASVLSVPEPGSSAALAAGLIGLAALARRVPRARRR
jgi:hypothetical protein